MQWRAISPACVLEGAWAEGIDILVYQCKDRIQQTSLAFDILRLESFNVNLIHRFRDNPLSSFTLCNCVFITCYLYFAPRNVEQLFLMPIVGMCGRLKRTDK